MAYVIPTPEDFLARFPEFSDVYESDVYLQLLIDEAARRVDTTWLEGDYTSAILYLTAHLLALSDQNAMSADGGFGLITSETLGRISLSYGGVAKAVSSSGLRQTSYGQEFAGLVRRNFFPILVV